jgi:cytoskeleton protein RodZ
MTSVGTYLRELRARRGVPLAEIARTTRVAQRYLESLEADAHDALPAPVFTRGYIRAFCQALGESPDEALACYDGRDGSVPMPAARPVPAARSGESRSRGAIVVSLVLLVVLGMALFTVALVIRPGERVAVETRPEARPTAPPTVAAPSASAVTPSVTAPAPTTAPPAAAPVPTAPPTAAAPAPAARPVTAPPAAPVTATVRPPASSSPAAGPLSTPGPEASVAPARPPVPASQPSLESVAGVVSPYRLVARTSDATWIRVRTEDGRSSEENVPAGEVREWVSDRPFVLAIGNAGGVSFELNGRALPPLGGRGTVIPRLVLPPDNR